MCFVSYPKKGRKEKEKQKQRGEGMNIQWGRNNKEATRKGEKEDGGNFFEWRVRKLANSRVPRGNKGVGGLVLFYDYM